MIYKFDYEMYPDGICEPLENFDESVWDRGYYLETNEGTWYEMFVTPEVKEDYPKIVTDKDDDNYLGILDFHGIDISNYEYEQITFFVPKDEKKYTLDYMTEIFL